tara:strand:- start:9 stop:362 length:354 start_codon:yes stop_codon:yes gene_type:complete
MTSLHNKVKLYLEANSKTDAELYNGNILLVDIGSGPYIETWNVDGLTKPTDSEIASYETAAITEQNNNNVRSTRKIAYGNIGDQLDLLYHDMAADKGDKTGEWFKAIKAVKDANSKD